MSVIIKYVFLSFFLFFSCNKKTEDSSVLVGKSSLEINKIKTMINGEKKDSLFVYNYISNWIEKELLFLGGRSVGLDEDLIIKDNVENYKKLLIGKNFINIINNGIKISQSEIKDYYSKNKSSFKRNKNSAKIILFSVENKALSIKIKNNMKKLSLLSLSDLVSKYEGVEKIFHEGDLPSEINNKIFNSKNFKKGSVLGPYKLDNKYFVFKIIKVYKKNASLGLDIVYNEIYQRIKNNKNSIRYKEIIDSLSFKYGVNIKKEKIRSLF